MQWWPRRARLSRVECRRSRRVDRSTPATAADVRRRFSAAASMTDVPSQQSHNPSNPVPPAVLDYIDVIRGACASSRQPAQSARVHLKFKAADMNGRAQVHDRQTRPLGRAQRCGCRLHRRIRVRRSSRRGRYSRARADPHSPRKHSKFPSLRGHRRWPRYAAALALGAEASHGTRFVCTREAPVHESLKQRCARLPTGTNLIFRTMKQRACLRTPSPMKFVAMEGRRAAAGSRMRHLVGSAAAIRGAGDVNGGVLTAGMVIVSSTTSRPVAELMNG